MNEAASHLLPLCDRALLLVLKPLLLNHRDAGEEGKPRWLGVGAHPICGPWLPSPLWALSGCMEHGLKLSKKPDWLSAWAVHADSSIAAPVRDGAQGPQPRGQLKPFSLPISCAVSSKATEEGAIAVVSKVSGPSLSLEQAWNPLSGSGSRIGGVACT